MIKWIGGGVAVVVILAGIAGQDKSAQDKTRTASQTPLASVSPGGTEQPSLPEQQSRLLAVTAEYSDRFASASNELQQSVLRDERRSALVKALGLQRSVAGWRGKITRLETNTEGKAILSVRLSPNTDIGTWNNALSDIMDGTLIEKGTPLYTALLTMSVGDAVTVSGSFLPSDEDGVKETSLTIRGAMSDPEFLFHFNDISKQ
ncbi:hypothetical protein [Rhizobium grahamii]|uniref:Uncharacterized protein n=1 Tax=Rhizobium grahamii TaxID=1120045 RepID=A0A370KP42_9HYPH|nr:hypothetical protein [Rhizobium grahamii]RDJ11098.1 hypothetical protein B5K06_12350 [Rhizobium grahamii]